MESMEKSTPTPTTPKLTGGTNPAAPSDHPTTKEAAFSKFPKLPIELRLKIWADAITSIGPRTAIAEYEILNFEDEKDATKGETRENLLPHTQNPSILFACHESRDEAKKVFSLQIKNQNCLGPVIFFRPGMDILLFTDRDSADQTPEHLGIGVGQEYLPLPLNTLRRLAGADTVSRIENLMLDARSTNINITFRLDPEEDGGFMEELIMQGGKHFAQALVDYYPGVKRLIFQFEKVENWPADGHGDYMLEDEEEFSSQGYARHLLDGVQDCFKILKKMNVGWVSPEVYVVTLVEGKVNKEWESDKAETIGTGSQSNSPESAKNSSSDSIQEESQGSSGAELRKERSELLPVSFSGFVPIPKSSHEDMKES